MLAKKQKNDKINSKITKNWKLRFICVNFSKKYSIIKSEVVKYGRNYKMVRNQ